MKLLKVLCDCYEYKIIEKNIYVFKVNKIETSFEEIKKIFK